MKMTLTNGQYRELVELVFIGSFVKTSVCCENKKRFLEVYELEKHVLSSARDFQCEDLLDNLFSGAHPSQALIENAMQVIGDYENDLFWRELELRLGQRDFYKNLSYDERKSVDKGHMIPDKMISCYSKYAEEFRANGLERLEIRDAYQAPAIVAIF